MMDILLVANHKNRGINCSRPFHSGTGLLPTPLKSCSDTKTAFLASPKTPSSTINENHKGVGGSEKRITHPIPIKKMNYEKKMEGGYHFSEKWAGPAHSYSPSSSLEFHFAERPAHSFSPPSSLEIHFSERWAGPAYSNSPPPSSLPIPKFSLRPKRTVSLDLPYSPSEIDLHDMAKSAPVSPTRERSLSPNDFFDSADSATKTLRRMLNLDITDE